MTAASRGNPSPSADTTASQFTASQFTASQFTAPQFTMRRVITVLLLTVMWCALWQQASAANIVSGLAVALAVTALGIGTAGTGGIRPWPIVKLVALIIGDLITSTMVVAMEIMTPTDYTEESIIAVDLAEQTRPHFLVLVTAITLTPGTAVVDTDVERSVLYLHLLHHDKADEVVAHIHKLAHLVCQALPNTAPEGSS